MWDVVKKSLERNRESWFYDGERNISYQEVKEMAEKIGCDLSHKLQKGSKCGVLCDNEMMTAIGILSCWSVQMIPVPMSMNYGEKNCTNIIESSELKYLITDNKKYCEKFHLYTYDLSDFIWYGEFAIQLKETELEGVAAIMNTSGTTGMPKGVLISNEGLLENLLNISYYFKINRNDVILIARPLYHCAVLTGEFLISLYIGLNICFYRGTYNPLAVIHYINSYKISVMCGTPTLFEQISNHLDRTKQQTQLRVMALSGEILTSKSAEKIRGSFKNTEIYNVYGLTEASPRVSFLSPSLFDTYPGSVGVPLENVKITIRDDQGNIVDDEVHGNVYVESTSLMKGYYRKTEYTAEKLTPYGLMTGDIGYLDKEKRLYILSRADDMIIVGGMNIYPAEIENIIREFPFIMETVVYGKHDESGQRIVANIVLRDGYKELTKRDIMSAFSQKLPRYLMPGMLEIVDCLKRSGSGKVIRPRI